MRGFKQGEIVSASFDPTLGTEMRGCRSLLMLSNSEFNRFSRVQAAMLEELLAIFQAVIDTE